MKRGAEESDVYDFKSMLDEFNSHMDRPPMLLNKRRKSRIWLLRKSKRSPFTSNREFTHQHANFGTPPGRMGSTVLSTPPESPPSLTVESGSSKRRKTKEFNSQTMEDFYCGDQYEIDFRRRDLCLQMQLLKTSDNEKDYEDALIWSSSENEDEDEDDS